MKILIYGAGIQGSYLAHSLIKGNNQVTLLARGKRKKELLERGLVLHHVIQHKHTKDPVHVIETLQPDDFYDLIFVTMKYSDFPAVLDPLAQNCSSTILFIGNQIDDAHLEKKLQEKSRLPKDIYFGFQMTGGTNTEKGLSVLRFGKGQMKIGSLHESFAIAPILDRVFKHTNYVWHYDPKLDDWLKNHATMIMIQNSFEYLYDFSAETIRKSGDLSTLADSFKEGFDLLVAAGHEILPKGQKFVFEHPSLTKKLFTLYYRLPISQMVQGDFREIYTLILDFERYQTNTPSELETLLLAAKRKYEKSHEPLAKIS